MANPPTPHISFSIPSSCPIGSVISIDVYGYAFDSTCVVMWGSTPLHTWNATYNHLIADIPSTLTNAAANVFLTVVSGVPVTSNNSVPFSVVVGLPESPHPYNNPSTHIYTVPGSPANIWVTFDPQTYMFSGDYSGTDYLQVTSGDGTTFNQQYTGYSLSGKTLKIPGNTVIIGFPTVPYGGNFYGFKVIDIRAAAPPASSYLMGNRNGEDEPNSVAFGSQFDPPYGPVAATHPTSTQVNFSNRPVQRLPDIAVNMPYQYQFVFPNAVGAVTWAITAGSLPPGIVLNEGSAVATVTVNSGTPSSHYQVNDIGYIVSGYTPQGYQIGQAFAQYKVTAVDNSVSTGVGTPTALSIIYGGAGYVIATGLKTFPITVGQTSSGGRGLLVNVTGLTDTNGAISGTAPSVPFTYNFTVTGTDTAGNSTTGQYELLVFANPFVIVDMPNGSPNNIYPVGTSQPIDDWFFGWNGDLYAVMLVTLIAAPGTTTVLIKKSIDNGSTWTQINTGDAHVLTHNYIRICQSGGKIYFCFFDTLTVEEYDIVSNTYTTLFNITSGLLFEINKIIQKPDGTLLLFGTDVIGSGTSPVQLKMISGDGTVATTVSTNNTSGAGQATLTSVLCDATGALHVFYNLRLEPPAITVNTSVSGSIYAVNWVSGAKFFDPGMWGAEMAFPSIGTLGGVVTYVSDQQLIVGTATIGNHTNTPMTYVIWYSYYVRIAPDGTVGTPVQLDPYLFNPSNSSRDSDKPNQFGHGYIRAEQDEIVLPFNLIQGVIASYNNNSMVCVLRGSPLNAPTFTTEYVGCQTNNDFSNYAYFGSFGAGLYGVEGLDGSDVIFFTGFDQYFSDTDYGAFWKVQNKHDGNGWSFRDRFYSAVTIPMYPPVVGSDQFTYWQVVFPDNNAVSGYQIAFQGNPGNNGTSNIQNSMMLLQYPPSPVPPVTVNSTYDIGILTPIFDNGTPRQRKDSFSMRGRFNGDPVNFNVITDFGEVLIATFETTDWIDFTFDLAQPIDEFYGDHPTWYQVHITGTASSFYLEDMEIFFDERPVPLTFKRQYYSNFGTSSPKRMRAWQFMIDTRGMPVTFTPYMDGVALTPVTFITNEKRTVQYSATTDLFGIDYGYTFAWTGAIGTGLGFELWDDQNPEFVESLPQGYLFWQCGPAHLFRYGRMLGFELRVYPGVGCTSINYTIYFDDNTRQSGVMNVQPQKQNTYYVEALKGEAGSVTRIEFGPTTRLFYPYYVRGKFQITGTDTDGQWINIVSQ